MTDHERIVLKKHLHTIIHSEIEDLEEIGDTYCKDGKYAEAVSCYSRQSRALFALNEKILPQMQDLGKVSGFAMVQLNTQRAILKNNRAECYMKLRKYEQSLTDLNWIINNSKDEYGPKQNWKIDMLSHYERAISQRADILLYLGNTAMSLTDCMDGLKTFDHEINYLKNHDITNRIVRIRKLQAVRHPSPQTLVNIQYNRFTRKLNKFAIDGWRELKTKNNLKTLPLKQGHSMIAYKNKIYCFGGTSAEYGAEICSNCDAVMFYQISIHQTKGKNFYQWKKLPFPNKFKYKIIGKEDLYHDWSRLVTILKWKGKLILIGGNVNPFRNVLSFSFSDTKWSVFPIKQIAFTISSTFELKNHCAVILKDKLFVFGGGSYGNNLLFCLDLTNKIWTKLCGTDDDSIINRQLPPHRYDHIMWTDKNKGDSGCIYIGYGSYFRSDLPELSYSCSRYGIWRYDVATNKWSIQSICGNFPARRAESGFAAISRKKHGGIVIFGGYCSTLPSLYSVDETKGDKPFLCTASYFGDCFEFLGKTGKWRMIHATKFPSSRALPAMCKFKNFIVLYGGYHAGIDDFGNVFNDLWILDKNKWKRKHWLKYCMQCNKSSNECVLYLCKKCRNTRYCSRKCQKQNWLNHKPYCSTSVIA